MVIDWTHAGPSVLDDGNLAAAILLLAIVWLVLSRLALPSGSASAILSAGLVVILIESATRRARAGRGK